MKSQYRVIWKREGNRSKHRLFAGLPSAERYVGILTSPEPWKFLRDTKDKSPDDLWCCEGGPYSQCACGGMTVRQWCDERRDGLPRIEYCRIERRDVGPWAEPVAEGGQLGE